MVIHLNYRKRIVNHKNTKIMTNANSDTIANVNTLITKIRKILSTTIGVARLGWIQFLQECREWVSYKTATTKKLTTSFDVGNTYSFGWIGDSNMISTIKVIKKTKCFLSFEYSGEIVRGKIYVYDGIERVYPTGHYSMAPCCGANKKV